MKILVAQLNPRVGDLQANSAKLVAAAGRAADLVVAPELALCGYPPQDLLDWPVFLDRVESATAAVIRQTGAATLVFGTVWRAEEKLFNGAVVARDGREVARIAKQLLPAYDVFDEKRWFTAGRVASPVPVAGHQLGIHICEDAWSSGYDRDPVAELAKAGADLLVNLSASPWSRGHAELREGIGVEHARRHRVPFLLVNQVGGNDELVFDGGSFMVDGSGETVFRAPSFTDGIYETGDVCAPPGRTEALVEALVLGIRDYFRKTGFSRVLLGLSGGIDSAVAACLACDAVGAENVELVAMPGPHSSSSSLSDARSLAESLGAVFHVHPITASFEAVEESFRNSFGRGLEGLARQNAQARCRGALLMNLANDLGALVLNTGNKSELATGYCTLLGDVCGALSVLGDLLKREVVEVARWYRTHGGHVALDPIIEKPPSAELAPGQLDQDTLPPYDELDGIVDGLVRDHADPAELGDDGVRWQSVIDRNEYKRRQAPPVLRVTTKAFGRGRRRPLAQGFDPGWCP